MPDLIPNPANDIEGQHKPERVEEERIATQEAGAAGEPRSFAAELAADAGDDLTPDIDDGPNPLSEDDRLALARDSDTKTAQDRRDEHRKLSQARDKHLAHTFPASDPLPPNPGSD